MSLLPPCLQTLMNDPVGTVGVLLAPRGLGFLNDFWLMMVLTLVTLPSLVLLRPARHAEPVNAPAAIE